MRYVYFCKILSSVDHITGLIESIRECLVAKDFHNFHIQWRWIAYNKYYKVTNLLGATCFGLIFTFPMEPKFQEPPSIHPIPKGRPGQCYKQSQWVHTQKFIKIK